LKIRNWFFLTASALLPVVLALYVQTQHSFKHVIIPLVGSFIPGELQVESGSLRFPATLELTGLSYRHQEAGLSAQIDLLRLRLAAIPLLRERLLFFDELMIGHGEIQYRKGGTALSEKDRTTVDLPGPILPGLRWAVRLGRIDRMTVSVQAEEHEVAVADLQMVVSDVGPGRTGTIDLQGEVSIDRRQGMSRWAGRLAGTGSIQQDVNGSRFEWNVVNELIVRESPLRNVEAGLQAITLNQSMTGGYDVVRETVQAESTLHVRLGESRLIDASFRVRRTGSPDGTEMDLGVKVHEVTEQALNLLLNEEQTFRLRSAHVSGYVDIHALGERYAIRSVFTGQRLQGLFGRTATPPLDIDVAQTGTFDSGSRDLTVEIFDIHVADRHKVWLAGELKRTLLFKLGDRTAERENLEPSNPSQADWALTVNDIGVADLRPWLDVLRWKGLEGLRAGRVGGAITASGRSSGRAVDLSLRLKFSDLLMESAGGGSPPPAVTFDHVAQGTLTDFTRLRISSYVVTAAMNEQSRGTLHLSGTINLKAPATNLNMEGSLTLNDLQAAALNPLLASWRKTGFDHGRFNGTAQATVTGDLLKWEIDLRGRRVSLRLPGKAHPTMPLDLALRQAGHLNRRARVLQVDKAVLQAFEQSRPVLTAILDRPIHMALNGKGAGPATARRDTPIATLGIAVHRLDIEQLKARLEPLNIAGLDPIKTGLVNSQLTIRWWGEAEPLSVSGDLDVGNLTLDSGVVHVTKPVTFRNRIDATVKDSSLIDVTAWNIRVLAGSAAMAEARVSGSTDVTDGSADLALKFTTDNMTAFLAQMGMLGGPQLKYVAGGAVMAEGRLLSQGSRSPISLQATIRSRNLRLKPPPGHSLAYDIDLQGKAEVNAPRTVVELNPMTFTLKHAAKEAGTVMLWSRWPLVSSGAEATARIVARQLDCMAVSDLYKALPGRIPGPLPVNADLTMSMDTSRNGKFTLSGQETIGPVQVLRKDGGPTEATVRIEQNLNRHDDELNVTKFTLSADRPDGLADQATASGSINFGRKRRAAVKGRVASLDAGWYAALFSAQDSKPDSTTQQGSKQSPRNIGKQSDAQAFLANFDAEFSIGTVSYRSLAIGPGRLTAKGTEEILEVMLEPTGFAEGQVEGTVALKHEGAQSRMEWSGKGQGLNLESILQAVEPGEPARLTGIGSFQTSGGGDVDAKEGLTRRHLKGTGVFDITGGTFVRIPLFDFLAKYTRVQEFSQMGFTDLRGDLTLDSGVLSLDRMSTTATVSSLEGSGTMAEDGAVDGLVFVKVGPSLAKNVKIPCMSALLVLPDGFVALPFAVRVKGSGENLTYRVDPSPWDQAKGTISSFAGKMKNLVSGCREVL